jgi:hypothetical protein
VTLSIYVDDVLAADVNNITLDVGLNTVSFNTTLFPEGEHNVTFKAFDAFGHVHVYTIVLIIDNKGVPILLFETTADVVVGGTEFIINVDSDWTTVEVTVYVDDVAVVDYTNRTVDVSDGTFSFFLNIGNYSKAEHVVRIEMTTPEGETAEIERVFGFATFRIEEIASALILFAVALFIPIYRKRDGQPMKPVIILDLVFFGVIAVAFLILGINTIAFITWHLNLASIWAIGASLVFANWAIPFIMGEEE